MYQSFIGLEIHIHLLTQSKVFCGCRAAFGEEPNTNVCPVCMGYPGTLPALNIEAVRMAYLVARALNCSLSEGGVFARKNYFYPDMPKNYQISQFGAPFGEEGFVEIELRKRPKRVRIKEVHLEEDAGKMIHVGDLSLLDYNRAGTPLLEIVTQPDLEVGEEAELFLQAFRRMVRYLGVCDGNMEEGSLRCDANINLWIYEDGAKFATPIVEVKNMNSFKSLHGALEYEAERQLEQWRETRLTLQQAGKTTRGWSDKQGRTILQRAKEEAADYRYFPEPDIKPIRVTPELIAEIKESIGELPAQKRGRFVSQYGLTQADAENMTQSKAFCDYFEAAARGYADAKKLANWMLSEVKKALNERKIGIERFRVRPEAVAELLTIVDGGTISGRIAKDVFAEMAASGKGAAEIVKSRGLAQISDQGELEAIVERVIAENPESAAALKGGKDKALQFLMGQVMKATKGKANPALASELIRKKTGTA
jgi:aspartyl-tRNA(Asn)/glutamyl-tRNA(Gln) amidotransferase subunit B